MTFLVYSGCYNKNIIDQVAYKHMVLEAGKSKNKALADLVSVENIPPVSQMATFSLCLHMERG